MLATKKGVCSFRLTISPVNVHDQSGDFSVFRFTLGVETDPIELEDVLAE